MMILKKSLVVFSWLLLIMICHFYSQSGQPASQTNDTTKSIVDNEQKTETIKRQAYLKELTLKAFLTGEFEQNLIVSKDTIQTTLDFMIEDVAEDDPRLLKFVRSLINNPSENDRNLIENKIDYSQVGQSTYMDSLLKSKRNGFFVEAGAFDGEFISNSLFFELQRNWTGILIEPLPEKFSKLMRKNRKVFTLNACIAEKKPIVAKFRVSSLLSGRENKMSDDHKNRIKHESRNVNNKNFIYVPCFSLNTILKAIDVQHVDYFSLDVEGGELSVLNSIDFNKISISSFSIEYTGDLLKKSDIKALLQKAGYNCKKESSLDLYFFKNSSIEI